MNDLTTKHTTLSTTNDVAETLKFKLERLKEEEKDTQGGLADYIGLSIDELDAQLEYLKETKAMISKREKDLKEQKEAILEGSAQFLLEAGAERLSGIFVSSVTVTKGKEATTKKKFKIIEDKKEVEKYLISAGLAVMEEVEVPATKAKVRVNKRKIIVPEVEA